MLSRKTHYLQVALNSTPYDAFQILNQLPASERIIIEAGTPLIKGYGIGIVDELNTAWSQKLRLASIDAPAYVVADLKCMDRGATEAAMASSNNASAAIALGQAPISTLNAFIKQCKEDQIDSMVDMMNVDKPYQVLRKLLIQPNVVILHRGVDEENSKSVVLPIHMINKVKGAYNIMVSIAGGDTPREIQSASFNGADIIVVWKDFYQAGGNITDIAEKFLANIK